MTTNGAALGIDHGIGALPSPLDKRLTAMQGEIDALEADVVSHWQIGALKRDLNDQIDVMKQEIDALQIASVEKRRPWYHDVAVIIAVLTFIFSLITTVFAYVQSERQQTHNARVELREMIQRLSVLPKENAELTQIYTDTLLIGQLSGYIQSENVLLAKHAAAVMGDLEGNASAYEYTTVAMALANSGLYKESLQLFQQATGAIQDANDGVTVFRGMGWLFFVVGDIENGRAMYRRALDIFGQYPTDSAYYRDYTHAFTEMNWAHAEYTQGQCAEAQQHIERALQYAANLTLPGLPNQIEQQAAQTRAYIAQCADRPPQA